jgi:hypothetical protein
MVYKKLTKKSKRSKSRSRKSRGRKSRGRKVGGANIPSLIQVNIFPSQNMQMGSYPDTIIPDQFYYTYFNWVHYFPRNSRIIDVKREMLTQYNNNTLNNRVPYINLDFPNAINNIILYENIDVPIDNNRELNSLLRGQRRDLELGLDITPGLEIIRQ